MTQTEIGLLERPLKRLTTGQIEGRYPGLHVTTKTLKSGERVRYLYHRPTMTRLYAEPGTPAFEAEWQDAIKPQSRKRGAHLRERAPKTAKPTNVYFIRAVQTGLIKIGRAIDTKRRLSVLQVGSPDRLHLILELPDPAGLLEKRLHHELAAYRSHGEWFHACPALLDFIEHHNAHDA